MRQDGGVYYVSENYTTTKDWRSVPAGCTLVKQKGSWSQEQEVERTWQLSGYFPSRRDLVEKLPEEAVTPGYWYEYDCAAPEEVQGVEEMIAHTDFSLRDGVQEDIIGIIAEEAESYINGDKSLEEVTKVIQNRASTLVQEGV